MKKRTIAMILCSSVSLCGLDRLRGRRYAAEQPRR